MGITQLSPLCLLGLQLVLQRCLRSQCPNPSPCLCADLPLPEGAPGVVGPSLVLAKALQPPSKVSYKHNPSSLSCSRCTIPGVKPCSLKPAVKFLPDLTAPRAAPHALPLPCAAATGPGTGRGQRGAHRDLTRPAVAMGLWKSPMRVTHLAAEQLIRASQCCCGR